MENVLFACTGMAQDSVSIDSRPGQAHCVSTTDTYREMHDKFQCGVVIGDSSLHGILTKAPTYLNYRKIYAQRVPRQLPEKITKNRMFDSPGHVQ